MAVAVLEWLSHQHLIEVSWSGAPFPTPSTEILPIEQVSWRFTWVSHVRPGLLEGLEDHLEVVPLSEEGLGIRTRLWTELAFAEAEHFYEQQLVKHHFDAGWSQDFGFAHQALSRSLSASQWRYCVWAAVRHGASVAQQKLPSKEGVREAIFSELQRRSRKILSGELGGCSLPPGNPMPTSAIARIFTNSLCRLGSSYWQMPDERHLFERGYPKI